jgi:hypothetical protein
MYWDNYKHLLQQIAKNILPKFIHMKKKKLGKRTSENMVKYTQKVV